MRILVTGADGYIGNQLTKVLEHRHHDVVGLDAGFFNNGWLCGENLSTTNIIPMDVRELEVEDLYGFQAVVHLAELSNDPLGQMNRRITREINHRGSVSLAQKCKLAGVSRFVYSSSCSVYGTDNGEVKTEESPTDPQTVYAECKLLVERDISKLADVEFSPVFLRNATAFGFSPRMRFDLVLNNLAGLAWTTRQIKMTGDGTPWRPVVHVYDIAEAMACVLEAPRQIMHNEVFNVGSNRSCYRVQQIAEIIAEEIPGCELTFGNSDGDNRSYRVCFDKIETQLPNFKIRHDARFGVQQLRQIFEQIDMKPETFEFRAFTRLNQIRHLIKTDQLDDNLCWRARKPR